MAGVFRLGEAVGVEEDGIIVVHVGFLFLEIHSGKHAQWKVGLDGEFALGVGEHYRSVVSGVAVAQMAVRKVEDAAEEGDEHIALVQFRHAFVHCGDNALRTSFMGGYRAEKTAGDSHHQ